MGNYLDTYEVSWKMIDLVIWYLFLVLEELQKSYAVYALEIAHSHLVDILFFEITNSH